MSDPSSKEVTTDARQGVRFRAALEAVLRGETKAVMHYQPIVDLRRGTVAGYEALVRFPSPPHLPPDEWFRSAALRGKRMQLEAMAAFLALEDRSRLPSNTFLTVNVSPVFLLSEEFDRLLSSFSNLNGLVLEVTEGDRIYDYVAVRRRLERVRTMGAMLAVDDTGSGYASLKHVMELNPQFVKLDRFFIESCHDQPSKAEMIYMIGEAADRMDAWLIAEGIETHDELNEVMRRMVPLGQGYLLGRPCAEMGGIPDEARTAILAFQHNIVGCGVAYLLESARSAHSLEEAESMVRSAQPGASAVVLDEHGRPCSLVEHHRLFGVRNLPGVMRFAVATQPSEVLRRAIGRPIAQRFDPVAITGVCGEFLGILRIDHLMRTLLLQMAEPPAP